MKQRNLIAKKNLKKSIYLGGGMAAFTAAIGLAVSIPVYNSIQAKLKQTTSKLKDLSGMMSELTSKLGIPEGTSFQKELAGGYEVVYENGQTKIYKNTGEGKSLIINMNGDGTVGSAAQMQGPAAQTMLGVIQNAKASMESDQAAMADIIGPFANQAEDTSLATESAITGESVAALAQRNALSAGEDAKAQEIAKARLAALEQRNKDIDAKALEDARARALELKNAAEAAKKAAEDIAAAEKAGNEKVLQDLKDTQANESAKVVSEFINYLDIDNPTAKTISDINAKILRDKKQTSTIPADSDDEASDEAYDAPVSLDDNQVVIFADILKGWADVIGKAVPQATEGADKSREFLKAIKEYVVKKYDDAKTNDQKNQLKLDFQDLKIKAADARLKQIKADVAAAVEKAKVLATQKTTSHQMDHAAAAGHVTPAIVLLAKSLPNAINALMAAKYGYIKDGVFKPKSDSVYKLIKQAMAGQGVSASTFATIEKDIITPLYEATKVKKDGHDIPGTISFSEVVNTFALKETSVNRLLVIKASYKESGSNGKDIDQLFLANQTTKSPIDFETTGDKLQTIKSLTSDGKVNTLYTAANYLVEAITRDINPSITKDATITLKKVVNEGVNGALNGIKNPDVFYQLVEIAKPITENNPIQEKALVEILVPLSKKYLFDGIDVSVDGNSLVQLIENAFKYDGTIEPSPTLDATEQDVPIEYGPLTKYIIDKVNANDFTDYTKLTKGSTPLIGFVKPSIINIKEVEQLMEDPTIVKMLPSFKELSSTKEGQQLIDKNWDLAFATLKRADVNDVLKIIDNQEYKEVTNDIDKMKDILSIKDTPLSIIDKNLDQLFNSIKTTPTNSYLLKEQWNSMGLPLLQSKDFDGSLKILNEPKFAKITANAGDVEELFEIKGTTLTTIHDFLEAIIDAMGATWVKNNKQWTLDNVVNKNIQKMILDNNNKYIMTEPLVRDQLKKEMDIDSTLTKLDSIFNSMKILWVKNNKDWMLSNINDIHLQDMIKDANKEYIMTEDDVRTKLLAETNIASTLTKLDVVISKMSLKWVQANQDWVLDNMDNDNLQEMIKDTNFDYIMNDSDVRTKLLAETDIASTLTKLDAIVNAMNLPWVKTNQVWVLDNLDDDHLQTMIKDVNKEYIMTEDDVRTKLLAETDITSTLTKLDAIISKMSLKWVQTTQGWVLDNMDNDNLQAMIKDTNFDYIMNDSDVRTKLLAETDITSTLTKLDAIVDAMNLPWVKTNQVWVLDNLDDDHLQDMIKDVNKEYIMTEDDVRTKLLAETDITSTLTKLDAIISKMSLKWVQTTQGWVLDNMDNDNLQAMIKDTNFDYIMNDSDVRTKLLAETDITSTLTKLDAIVDAMNLPWVKTNQVWVLDNLDDDHLQDMIKDVNKEYIMTEDDVRTKLLAETDITSTLTKLDAIISKMSLKWVQANQDWVLDNMDNDNLQAMIKDTNFDYIMNDSDVRTKLLAETDITSTLTKLDAIVDAMNLPWVKTNQVWVLDNLGSDYLQDMIKNKNKDLFMSDITMRDSILKGGVTTTLTDFNQLVDIWGYEKISSISDEEKSFRDLMIHQNVDDKNIQLSLKAGDITSEDIHKAFEILAQQGYISSAKNSDVDKVKTYSAFASKVSVNKEFVLSILSTLGKYSKDHDELNKGDYINKVIDAILGDESFAKVYITFANKEIDLVSSILEKAKTDSIYDLSFAIPYEQLIFMDEDVKLDVIKSVQTLANYIKGFEDTDGTDEVEITNFVENLKNHLFDSSTSADIDKVTTYIEHMIDRSNSGRTPNSNYPSQGDKDGTMRQIKMYGDKFFGTDAIIDQKVGDDATSSLNQVIALEAKAGPVGSPARARLALISKFPTIADAWQSGIVDAKPVVDPAFASQADQAIPTTIKSIGYDQSRNVFYMIGTLSGADSIKIPTSEGMEATKTSYKVENGKIIYDRNHKYSMFVFEAKLIESNGAFTLQYHRVTSMDFVIENDYNSGRTLAKGSWHVDHMLSTSSVSTFNPSDKSFIAYGSGGSYANGHSKIWYDGSWKHKYVDWGPGHFTSVGGVITGSPAKSGQALDGHSIGNSWHIGMSTIVDGKLYAAEDERSNWYEIQSDGATNALMFSSVPNGYYQVNPANAKARLKIPRPNMIGTIENPKDETSGNPLNGVKWAVFINSFDSKQLMRLDLVHHKLENFELYEMNKDGNLVLSHQSFEGSQAITTTASGSIYVTAGHPVIPATPEVKAVAEVKEVKDADGKLVTKGVAAVAHKDAVAEQPGTQQVYRIFLSDGKWQIEKVGNVIDDLKNPITSIYHYTQTKDGKDEQFISAISLDGVKVIKDIFAQ